MAMPASAPLNKENQKRKGERDGLVFFGKIIVLIREINPKILDMRLNGLKRLIKAQKNFIGKYIAEWVKKQIQGI